MPLVSRGVSWSASIGRQASHLAAPSARARPISYSHYIPHPPPHPGSTAPNASMANKLFRQTMRSVTRFFTHLTTPGFSHPIVAKSIYHSSNAARPTSIHQRLSLPVRHTLSRGPSGPPFLPRPLAVSRNAFEVGLGTARKFSTGRPIFQHLVENIPVAARSFYEAPSKMKRKAELEAKKPKRTAGSGQVVKSKSLLKKNKQKTKEQAIIEEYFAEPATPAVTTFLQIPLAPTPTSRVPLSSNSNDESRLLPLSTLAHLHVSHEMHSRRVSALFTRLDMAHVWNNDVTCSALGDPSGLCTVLKLEFKGWTEAMVKAVLGDAGNGWCSFEEVWNHEHKEELESISSLAPSPQDVLAPLAPQAQCFDPSDSLVLPRLDFSSSFTRNMEEMSSPCFSSDTTFPPSPVLSSIGSGSPLLSEVDELSEEDLELLSDSEEGSETSSDFQTFSLVERESGWMVFSSDFAYRAAGFEY